MGKVQQICASGVPLGLFPDTQYDEVIVDLRPGDIVLFASDGILETENTEQEEFGLKRLTAVLKPFHRNTPQRKFATRSLTPPMNTGAADSLQAMTAPCWCCA